MLIQSELKSACVINTVKITESEVPTVYEPSNREYQSAITAVLLYVLILVNNVIRFGRCVLGHVPELHVPTVYKTKVFTEKSLRVIKVIDHQPTTCNNSDKSLPRLIEACN